MTCECLQEVVAARSKSGDASRWGLNLWIDNHFRLWTAKEDLQRIQNISAEDSLVSCKVGVKLAWILLAVQMDPDRKAQRGCQTAGYSSPQGRHSLGWIELELLTVDPWQCAGIGAGVGDDLIKRQTCNAGLPTKFGTNDGQRFDGVRCVVAKYHSSHPIRFAFAADTNHKRMFGGLMRCVQYMDGAFSDSHDRAICETDPLPLILRQKLVANRPVCRFILAPFRMDLSCNLRRKSVGKAFHRAPL